MRLGLMNCVSAKCTRIHDNIIIAQTLCVRDSIRLRAFLRLILAPPPKGQQAKQGSREPSATILQKSGFDTKKSLTRTNNQDSAITLLC